MRFVIVSGMSGAGKSTALKMLEDVGYFCADNLPVPLIPKFAELVSGWPNTRVYGLQEYESKCRAIPACANALYHHCVWRNLGLPRHPIATDGSLYEKRE